MAVAARAIGIMAKAPVAGAVKTRLTPPLDPQQAARLYGAFLHDTAATALIVPESVVVLFHPPADDRAALRAAIPAGVTCVMDAGEGLGESMHRAFLHHFDSGAGAAVIIGADLPTLPARIIESAFVVLERGAADAVFGPATDGGYYLIGLRAPQPALFEDMRWGTSGVLEQTLDRARRAGLRVACVDAWYDIDEPADLPHLVRHLDAVPELTARATRRVLADLWPGIRHRLPRE